MPEVTDILKREGWAAPEGWRAYHYMVATGEDASTDPAQPVPLARSLCSTKVPGIQMIVPDDGFWPAPPRSSGAQHDDMGACDICKLASRNREWAKDDAGKALKDMLWALTSALGKEARQNVHMNLGGQITPEVVCDALGQLQRQASSLHSQWARAERELAAFEIAKAGLIGLLNPDSGPPYVFTPEVVDALLKSKGVRL